MYDLFFVIRDNKDTKDKLRAKFPLAKFCIFDDSTSVYEILNSAQKRSLTKMFWVVDINYEVKDDFKFDYNVSVWDEKYIHIFKEEKTQTYGGVYLIPKTYRITKNEANHVFFINKKEISIVASKVSDYEVFTVETYNDYLKAREISNTEMFYVVYSDLILSKDFVFDYNIEMSAKHLNHIFKNGDYYDGVFITSKKKKIT